MVEEIIFFNFFIINIFLTLSVRVCGMNGEEYLYNGGRWGWWQLANGNVACIRMIWAL